MCYRLSPDRGSAAHLVPSPTWQMICCTSGTVSHLSENLLLIWYRLLSDRWSAAHLVPPPARKGSSAHLVLSPTRQRICSSSGTVSHQTEDLQLIWYRLPPDRGSAAHLVPSPTRQRICSSSGTVSHQTEDLKLIWYVSHLTEDLQLIWYHLPLDRGSAAHLVPYPIRQRICSSSGTVSHQRICSSSGTVSYRTEICSSSGAVSHQTEDLQLIWYRLLSDRGSAAHLVPSPIRQRICSSSGTFSHQTEDLQLIWLPPEKDLLLIWYRLPLDRGSAAHLVPSPTRKGSSAHLVLSPTRQRICCSYGTVPHQTEDLDQMSSSCHGRRYQMSCLCLMRDGTRWAAYLSDERRYQMSCISSVWWETVPESWSSVDGTRWAAYPLSDERRYQMSCISSVWWETVPDQPQILCQEVDGTRWAAYVFRSHPSLI